MKIRNLEEDAFWQYIKRSGMLEQVMMCRHEDREISPGVPDLHYVPVGDPGESFRVGWLELKAKKLSLTSSNRIGVEPSQHQFMRRWLPHMPIHFLIRVKGKVYLIHGQYHPFVAGAESDDELEHLSVASFDHRDIATALPPLLKAITRI